MRCLILNNTAKDHDKFLIEILSHVDNRGYLKHRESTIIEFKENFNFSNMSKYTRTMAAFANNRGGYIVFGVKDSPRIPQGINKDRFNNIPQEKITTYLIEHFSPEIKWDMGIVDVKRRYFGYIYSYKAVEKPIICKKDAGNKILKSGEIYYRYRAQTRKIEYPELKRIIDEFREEERQIWMKHIERIAKIGPSNVALVDLLTGALNTAKLEDTKLIIDEALLDNLRDRVKFIEEGKFSEKEGEPTLKLIGKIQTVSDVVIPEMDPNKDYPYLQKYLAEELGLRPYDVQILIWKYKIKDDKKYHIEIEASKSSKVHKYSKYALKYLREILNDQKDEPEFLKKISKEYQNARKNTKNERSPPSQTLHPPQTTYTPKSYIKYKKINGA